MSRVRTLVATEILMLGGLLAFIAVSFGFEILFSLDAPVQLNPISALLLAIIPALLWLSYFHSQDRLEPEPKHYVIGSYLIGAFVAGPCAGFLVNLAESGPEPVHLSFQIMSGQRWIFAIAIVGIAQELSKYLVVRYTLYVSDEFDEPLDGIIYMSAAGIGFATYESYQFLQSSGGAIYLSAGAAQTVVTTLAHASFAGIVGFALGHAKFLSPTAKGIWSRRRTIIIAGLLAASLLNGCFHMIMDSLSADGLNASPWRRVFFSFGFAASVFLIISLMMRKLLAISPHHSNSDPSEDSDDE